MWVSNMTRVAATAELAKKALDAAGKRAAARAQAEAAIEVTRDAKADALVIRVSDRIVTVLQGAAGEWVVRQRLSQSLAGRDKKAMREQGIELDDILGDLIGTGAIELREPEGREQGARYRARRQP